MTGLIIGVVTIVVLISLTAGIKASFNDFISDIKGVYVMQKNAMDVPFSRLPADYEQKFESIPAVKAAFPEVWAIVRTINGGKALGGSSMTMGTVTMLGLDAAKEKLRNQLPYGVEIKKGRIFNPSEKYAAVVGDTIADKYKLQVGSSITVDGEKFRVVGIFEKNDFTGSTVAAPIDTVRKNYGFKPDEVSAYTVQAYNARDDKRIARLIEMRFDDVRAMTTTDMSKQLGTILSTIDLFFYVVAFIAFAIAGIGIINTMLMSVLERKKEFGTLRALGWTRDNVVKLVVSESAILGLGGGVIGLCISYVLVKLIESSIGFPLFVSPLTAAGALVFSMFAGIAGGFYPAWKASRLDPIRAIRGE